MKWKLLIMSDGIYFAGKEHLVQKPYDAKWFDDYSQAVEASKDIVALNLAGVTQVRVISEAFESR